MPQDCYTTTVGVGDPHVGHKLTEQEMIPDILRIAIAVPGIKIGCDLMVYYHELRLKHYLHIYFSILKWGFQFRLGKHDVQMAKKSDSKARAVVQETTSAATTPRLVPSE